MLKEISRTFSRRIPSMVLDRAPHHRHRLVECLAKQVSFDGICKTSSVRNEVLRFGAEANQARVDAALLNL